MNNQGMSLLSLIIIIISIIIIASISLYNGNKTPDMANFTSFTSDMDNARAELGMVRAKNFEKYGNMDITFEEVKIRNAPEDFVSISKDEIKGYLISAGDLKDSKKFGNGSISGDTVYFDLDDLLVYDKNGTVYYAKGYYNDGQLFYNATSHKYLK